MPEDQLLTMEQALKELQIERDDLKELFRQNALRYVLEDGNIKIPKMALMALKLERMTSSTAQFKKITRARRKRGTSLTASAEQNMLTLEEASQMLEVEKEKLKEYIAANRLRSIEVDGQPKIPKSSAQALKIQMTSFGHIRKLPKNKPKLRRVY